MIHTPSRQLCP